MKLGGVTMATHVLNHPVDELDVHLLDADRMPAEVRKQLYEHYFKGKVGCSSCSEMLGQARLEKIRAEFEHR
jgi:hypothetical protein